MLMTNQPNKNSTIRIFIHIFIFFSLSLSTFAQEPFPFQDPKLPLEERVNDLINQMSLDEKIKQLHFDAEAIPRLGLKPWGYWNEALHGVARWGRTEEAYSEDPYLTGRMGVAFVKGLQGNDPDHMLAAATVKHFVADNSEFQRSISSSYTDMRDLREYYFPAFEGVKVSDGIPDIRFIEKIGLPCLSGMEIIPVITN